MRLILTVHPPISHALYSFEQVPQALWQVEKSVIVLSARMLYQFDDQMHLFRQIPYPEALPDTQRPVINAPLTKVAYCQDNSLYLPDLTPDAQPQQLYTYTYSKEDTMKVETIYPVRFINNERILAEVAGWYARIK